MKRYRDRDCDSGRDAYPHTTARMQVQSYGEDAYLHTGLYTFMTGPEDNRQPVEARFSYMWRKVQTCKYDLCC